mmetsp:Transcript_10779/g.27734  ORF Transcript_10779/g.27734 Transcript_10779/m.27734 type:complete len:216 (+) Transcript_10779:387-1034(+)
MSTPSSTREAPRSTTACPARAAAPEWCGQSRGGPPRPERRPQSAPPCRSPRTQVHSRHTAQLEADTLQTRWPPSSRLPSEAHPSRTCAASLACSASDTHTPGIWRPACQPDCRERRPGPVTSAGCSGRSAAPPQSHLRSIPPLRPDTTPRLASRAPPSRQTCRIRPVQSAGQKADPPGSACGAAAQSATHAAQQCQVCRCVACVGSHWSRRAEGN